MTPEQFTYWLQGFAEIADTKHLTEEQWKIIQDHLSIVFTKVTPTYPVPSFEIDTPKVYC